MNKLSVLIPTCNEKTGGYLSRFLEAYASSDDVEFLIIDDNSDSILLDTARKKNWQVMSLPSSNRGEKIALGLERVKSTLVCLHHPRSILPPGAFEGLVASSRDWRWGGFTHSFDRSSLGLRWTSWYSNFGRARLQKIVYLDHCIFFHRELLDQPVPRIPIFEDTEISKILRQHGSPYLSPVKATTSAVRFNTNGFLKQSLLNQSLKLGYLLGLSKRKMNSLYETKLNLNSSKSSDK